MIRTTLFALSILACPFVSHAEVSVHEFATDGCENINTVQCTVLNATNEVRAQHGLNELEISSRCQVMAQSHAYDMARNRFFSHTSPSRGTFRNRSFKNGLRGYTAENIARGHFSEEVVESWMNSPGHRRNILNSHYGEIGIGFARDANGRPYYVQCFNSGSNGFN